MTPPPPHREERAHTPHHHIKRRLLCLWHRRCKLRPKELRVRLPSRQVSPVTRARLGKPCQRCPSGTLELPGPVPRHHSPCRTLGSADASKSNDLAQALATVSLGDPRLAARALVNARMCRVRCARSSARADRRLDGRGVLLRHRFAAWWPKVICAQPLPELARARARRFPVQGLRLCQPCQRCPPGTFKVPGPAPRRRSPCRTLRSVATQAVVAKPHGPAPVPAMALPDGPRLSVRRCSREPSALRPLLDACRTVRLPFPCSQAPRFR